MDRPYVIVSPDYNPTSGGIKVMWGLYGWLLAKGCTVFMNKRPQGDVIAIYPEIESGNPVMTDRIVRYILNVPGVMGKGIPGTNSFIPGPTTFDKREKLYYFSRMFGEVQDENHYLFLPVINLHVFKDLKKKRNKTCFLVGKGYNTHKHQQDSIELTRKIAEDQDQLNDLLNECHTFYCYDKLTAMMEVSRLAGCKVEYYGDYTMKELKQYEPGLNGINSELNIEKFRDHYEEMVFEFEEKLDLFIEETQSW
jgi:hypothetical protein